MKSISFLYPFGQKNARILLDSSYIYVYHVTLNLLNMTLGTSDKETTNAVTW